MLTPIRRSTWWAALMILGVATPSTAQQRSWMQATPRPAVAAPASLPVVEKPAALQPTTTPATVLAPSPQWLPSSGPSLAVAPAPSNSTTAVAPPPAATTTVYYPLPGANGTVLQTSATKPTAGVATVAPAARSPYAAAYLSARQPTLAPPQGGPTIVDSGAALGPPATTLPLQGPSSIWTGQSPMVAPQTTDPAFDPNLTFEPDPAMAAAVEPSGSWFSYVPRPRPSWFFAVSGLVLTRDVPNNVELAYSQTVPQIALLNTEQVGMNQWVGGAEMRLGRALGDFGAFEFVYWATQSITEQLKVRDDNNQINSRLDFQDLFYQGTPLSDIFDNSHEQRIYRGDAFENIEMNFLQQAMVVDPTDRFGMTGFTGIRYFRFDEMLKYEAVAANAEFADNNPATQTNYWVREHNRMLGWQLGGRWHARVGQRWRLFAMPRFGLFGNRIGQIQHACMVLDDHANKTDVTLMGQIDLGLTYQVFACCSLYCSYRAMAFSSVATADDNVARTFTSPPALDSINSSGSLILHGWQIGSQFQF